MGSKTSLINPIYFYINTRPIQPDSNQFNQLTFMRSISLLSWWILLFLAAVVCGQHDRHSHVKQFTLNITSIHHNPDCSNYTGNVLALNGLIPGPPIIVTKGDRVQVTVNNNLPPPPSNASAEQDMTSHASIHFHGIRQYGSTEADGVPFLTQVPIAPGGFYVYDFKVTNQAGTYLYHAHVGMQEMSVYGAIIVYESPEADPAQRALLDTPQKKLKAYGSTYDDERTIVLSEWWHRDRVEFEKYLLGPTFNGIWEAESILLNGKTVYQPIQTKPDACKGYDIIPVERNKTYRIRVIGATAFRTLGFAIANHSLTIIEVDGEPVEPYVTSFLEVASGQRFSVLITADQEPTDYSIGTTRRWTDATVPATSNGYAVLRYQANPPSPPRRRSLWSRNSVQNDVVLQQPKGSFVFAPEKVGWIWDKLTPFYGAYHETRRPADRTVVLRSTDEKLADGSTRWFVNGISFKDPKNNYLSQVLNETRAELVAMEDEDPEYANGYDPKSGMYPVRQHEIVDFVLQSTHSATLPCRSHPWHTHGHSHWEISYGAGDYDHDKHGALRSEHPVHRDVTLVYPTTSQNYTASNPAPADGSIGCGWSKIRIFADNPGIWALHCHNTAHMFMGMMVAIEESPELIRETDTIHSHD
ncbi:Cupredoxin [Phycomyces nitens]|nr:Cupredoxin [Phycomyces nitens]